MVPDDLPESPELKRNFEDAKKIANRGRNFIYIRIAFNVLGMKNKTMCERCVSEVCVVKRLGQMPRALEKRVEREMGKQIADVVGADGQPCAEQDEQPES